MKNSTAVIVGLIVSGLVIFLLYILAPQFFTFPDGTSPTNPQSIKDNIDAMPSGVFVLIVFAHFFGIIGGMLAATAASQQSMYPAYIVFTIVALGCIISAVSMPHPTWAIILEFIILILAYFIGKKVASKRLQEDLNDTY